MQVTPSEFEHINAVYMNSDLDKDDFCVLWVKMNQGRVNKAKAEAKVRKEQEELRDNLWNIISKYGGRDYAWMERMLVFSVLTKKEQQVVEQAGLAMKEYDIYAGAYLYKRMSTMLYEIRKYLKAA